MKQKTTISLVIIFLFFSLSVFNNSCKHQPQNVSTLRTVCFESEVLPIFQSNCTMPGCHNDSKEDKEFNLKTYNEIIKFVSPGKPLNSEIYKVITNKFGEIMPPSPNNPLSESQRSLIYVWILQGAKTCDTTLLK